LSVIYNPGL